MRKVLLMIISSIIVTIITLSALLVVNNVTTGFQEAITEVSTEVLESEVEVLLSGNSTVNEFRDMQDTLRGLNERIAGIFE